MNRTIRVMAGIFILLLIGSMLLVRCMRRSHNSRPLAAYDADAITKISVASGTGTALVLARAGGRWTMPDHPAYVLDEEAVGRMVENLRALEVQGLI